MFACSFLYATWYRVRAEGIYSWSTDQTDQIPMWLSRYSRAQHCTRRTGDVDILGQIDIFLMYSCMYVICATSIMAAGQGYVCVCVDYGTSSCAHSSSFAV